MRLSIVFIVYCLVVSITSEPLTNSTSSQVVEQTGNNVTNVTQSFPRYFDIYGKNKESLMASISTSLYGADEQCKILFGKEARFCRQYARVMCKTLYCRKLTNSSCEAAPVGALEGTTCESGKICMKNFCSESPKAPLGECLFGDDVVTEESIGMRLPSPQMSCNAVLDYIVSVNQTTTAYCSNSNFRHLCCQTCKKYDILTCTDKYFDCMRYKSVCTSGAINGLSVNILCQRTCQKCPVKPAYCESARFVCENGGTCRNLTNIPSDSLFGFTCDCPRGYYGELCELKNSCVPNPCTVNQRCEVLGNVAFRCVNLPPSMISTPQSTAQQIQATSKSSPPQAKYGTVNDPSLNETSRQGYSKPTGEEKPKNYYFINYNSNNKANNCVDYDPGVCGYYASLGLCKSYYYLRGTEITIKCPKSCHRC